MDAIGEDVVFKTVRGAADACRPTDR